MANQITNSLCRRYSNELYFVAKCIFRRNKIDNSHIDIKPESTRLFIAYSILVKYKDYSIFIFNLQVAMNSHVLYFYIESTFMDS